MAQNCFRGVSYPVSNPVEAVWFHTRFHTWFHTSRVTKALRPMESQGARKGICPTPAQRTPVRFHTGFIPGFIPEPSRPSSFPDLALTPAAGFISRFHTLGSRRAVSYPGFIPVSYSWFHTPFSYRFHTGFIPYRKNGRFDTP